MRYKIYARQTRYMGAHSARESRPASLIVTRVTLVTRVIPGAQRARDDRDRELGLYHVRAYIPNHERHNLNYYDPHDINAETREMRLC